jgi:thiamine-monophosphate kinase
MNERELIAQLVPQLPLNDRVIAGAGDDCAVIDLGLAADWVLFKIDATLEGVHFARDAEPRAVGHKALGRCLSDVAAMAGKPICALIALGLPAQFDPARVREIYAGINTLARRYQVAVAGGETSLSPDRLTLTVSLLGTVPQNHCVRRSGARPGDGLWVTGELGGSILGKHLAFEPRIQQAAWLRARFDLHAMIDLSDGLSTDARHLAQASEVGAELTAESIPISAAAWRRADDNASAALRAALNDGEDFELLFALPDSEHMALQAAWPKAFPDLKLTAIGTCTATRGLRLRQGNTLLELHEHGYDHFA